MKVRFTLAGLVLLAGLPFVNQAFHIDDRIYLEIAQNTLQNPLFPYDYPPIFEGLQSPDAASHSHLPLISYYLALVQLVTGSDQEWIYHLAFLIFPLIAAFSFYDLTGRFVRNRLPVSALLIVAPAFLVLSHTLMTDVPLLAFWLLTISKLVDIIGRSGSQKPPTRRDYLLFAVGILGSSFISLVSAGLVLLCIAYLFLEYRTGNRDFSVKILLLITVAPLLLWVLWYLRAYLYYDRFILLNTVLHIQKRQAFDGVLMGTKIVSFIVNIGAAILFPPLFWIAFRSPFLTRVMLILFLLTMAPFYIWFSDWDFVNVLLFAIFFAAGLLIMYEFLSETWQVSPASFRGMLILWFAGIFVSCLLLYYSGSVRYILLALPPVILLWAIKLEEKITNPQNVRYLLWGAFGLTFLYSLPVALADHIFADQYRVAAQELVTRYSAPGRQIWLTGEWGFRYYMEKAGGKILPRTGIDAKPGDILIKPFIASPWVTVYDSNHSRLVEQIQMSDEFPIRILDFSSHAGFYSTGWGILPFSWREGENWEWINVYEITSRYEGQPPNPERHW